MSEEEIEKMHEMLKQLQAEILTKDEQDRIKKIEDEYDNLVNSDFEKIINK
jgi:hypothetical protein